MYNSFFYRFVVTQCVRVNEAAAAVAATSINTLRTTVHWYIIFFFCYVIHPAREKKKKRFRPDEPFSLSLSLSRNIFRKRLSDPPGVAVLLLRRSLVDAPSSRSIQGQAAFKDAGRFKVSGYRFVFTISTDGCYKQWSSEEGVNSLVVVV